MTKILIDKETVELALRTFKSIDDAMFFSVAKHPMSQLRQALEQSTEQEPVGFMCRGVLYKLDDVDEHCESEHIYLYTTPPQRKPLTHEQEPVAWEEVLGAVARGWCYEENVNKTIDEQLAVAIAKEVQSLFITPPQRKPWIGLTDDEVRQMCGSVPSMKEAVREAEAKLKEKNCGG